MKQIILIIILAIIIIASFFVFNDKKPIDAKKVTIYIRDIERIDDDCEAVKAITRQVEGEDPVEFSIKSLLNENLSELMPSFEKVIIIGTEARIYFKRDALQYLNGPACLQMSYKSPIEKTLMQFEGVEKVEYYIEGNRFIEWDA